MISLPPVAHVDSENPLDEQQMAYMSKAQRKNIVATITETNSHDGGKHRNFSNYKSKLRERDDLMSS